MNSWATNTPKFRQIVRNLHEMTGMELFRYNENGAIIDVVKLQDPMLPGTIGEGLRQLIAVDEHLVLLKSAGSTDPFDRIYLINPSTGAVQLAVPEPSTIAILAVVGVVAAVGWRRSRR